MKLLIELHKLHWIVILSRWSVSRTMHCLWFLDLSTTSPTPSLHGIFTNIQGISQSCCPHSFHNWEGGSWQKKRQNVTIICTNSNPPSQAALKCSHWATRMASQDKENEMPHRNWRVRTGYSRMVEDTQFKWQWTCSNLLNLRTFYYRATTLNNCDVDVSQPCFCTVENFWTQFQIPALCA